MAVWKIHRRIGMSGGLFVQRAAAGDWATSSTRSRPTRLRDLHAEAYAYAQFEQRPRRCPEPAELLAELTSPRRAVGDRHQWLAETRARPALACSTVARRTTPLITRDQVRYAKPDPDLFLAAAELGRRSRTSLRRRRQRLGPAGRRRARALGVGLLSGGYGREELAHAGAFRVYEDPADLLAHLDELGVRRPL